MAALGSAGVIVAAFGGGVVPGVAQDAPTGAGPSDEVGRTAPAPAPAPPAAAPAPAPAVTAPAPAPTTTGPAPAPTTPAPTTKAPAPERPEDIVLDDPTAPAPRKDEGKRRRQTVAADQGAPAGDPSCAPKRFVAKMTPAERRRYLRQHPECREEADAPARVAAGGVPSPSDPTYAEALPGPAPIGVPNFFIEKFRIPPFLLSIYQAAGIEYGVRWEVLAAINEIETDYGRNLNVSSAGALGWMQFMPATWRQYGVDANQDGKKDPYNPVDAIFSAANYLKASGAEKDLRKAVFAYNHADWYVDSVLMRARLIGGLPADLVGSLTGLTQGRFPVDARATYADEITKAEAQRRIAKGRNAAIPVESVAGRRGIRIFAKPGSPVVATHDGEVVAIGRSPRLGRFVRVRDVYGNTYTYAQLGKVAKQYPVAKDALSAERRDAAARARRDERRDRRAARGRAADVAGQQADAARLQHTESLARVAAGLTRAARATVAPISAPADGDLGPVTSAAPAPTSELAANLQAAGRARTAGVRSDVVPAKARPEARVAVRVAGPPAPEDPAAAVETAGKERLFANPQRPRAFAAGGDRQLEPAAAGEVYTPDDEARLGLDADDVVLRELKVGSKVIAGTTLGRIGRVSQRVAPHLLFEIRPAGRGAPRIDPKPILDGWKLLESTAIYRARGKNPFFGPDAEGPTVGQILLMSKADLQRRVLDNDRIDVYDCGRRDIRAGIIDRRVLASLEVLAASGLRPTVTSLRCGHGYFTKSGNVSHHSSGSAFDIARINGTPILGNQGPGSVTDMAIRRLLTLQGTMKPSQIISLMTFEGADNTLSMPDHADHIHVGFQPLEGGLRAGRRFDAVLKPQQWIKLIDRLGQIDNPTVSRDPSKYALPVPADRDRASKAHRGE
jgi:murein DD-endopeptidase MepM/ murein hydrolase activator NlpD